MADQYHLAQINIARALYDMDSPEMADFVQQLDYINALAEHSPGFVWRLQTEDGDALAIQAFNDPRILINMSVWASLEQLKTYVYRSDHVEVFKKRKKWFEKMDKPAMALWWVPAGHIPTIEEAKTKLNALAENGPTAEAFTFSRPFPPPGVAV